MHCCVSFYKIWWENVYNIIIKLFDSNRITWLRNKMSYNGFPNLGELIQGDLLGKLKKGLAYKYFMVSE